MKQAENLFFDNLPELGRVSMSLDRAEEREVWTRKDGFEAVKSDKHKAVWNVDSSKLSCIASSNYAIVQHREIIEEFTGILQELGIDGSGILKNDGDRFVLDFVFSGVEPIKDDAKGIKLGIRVVNSYNKSTGLNGELYGYRLVCKNGMALGRAINDVKLSQIHIGTIQVKNLIKNFIRKAIDSSERLRRLVDNAIQDTLTWEYVQQVVTEAFKIEKYREMIQQDIDTLKAEGKTINRWDLYNIVTDIATHNEKVTVNTESTLQKKAQAILTDEILVRVPSGVM